MKLKHYFIGLLFPLVLPSCKKPVDRYCLDRRGEEHCLSEKKGVQYFEVRNDENFKRYNFKGLEMQGFVEFGSDGFKWYYRGDPDFPSDEEICKLRNAKDWVLLNWPR